MKAGELPRRRRDFTSNISEGQTSRKCDTDFHFNPPHFPTQVRILTRQTGTKFHRLIENISQPRGTGLNTTRILINDTSAITQWRIHKTDEGTAHDRQSTSVNSVTPINVGGEPTIARWFQSADKRYWNAHLQYLPASFILIKRCLLSRHMQQPPIAISGHQRTTEVPRA